jgi:hypothetical protein
MLRKVSRLFVIKTRCEAYVIIYALALGATERGAHLPDDIPGWRGQMLFCRLPRRGADGRRQDPRLPASTSGRERPAELA